MQTFKPMKKILFILLALLCTAEVWGQYDYPSTERNPKSFPAVEAKNELKTPYLAADGDSIVMIVLPGGIVVGKPLSDIGGGSSDFDGAPSSLDQDGANNGQVLKWNGSAWVPANDNTGSGGSGSSAGDGIVIDDTVVSVDTTRMATQFDLTQIDVDDADANPTNEIQTLTPGYAAVVTPSGINYTVGPDTSIVALKSEIYIDAISSLPDFNSFRIKQINVSGYYTKGDGGGGQFYWDESGNKADHNGGTVIDPDHSETIGDSLWYFSDNVGTGVWRRIPNNNNLKEFGARGRGMSTTFIKSAHPVHLDNVHVTNVRAVVIMASDTVIPYFKMNNCRVDNSNFAFRSANPDLFGIETVVVTNNEVRNLLGSAYTFRPDYLRTLHFIGNTIDGIRDTLGGGDALRGFDLRSYDTTANLTITNNTIRNIVTQNDGFEAQGILVSTGSGGTDKSNNLISLNIIENISGPTTSTADIEGIYCGGRNTTISLNIIRNVYSYGSGTDGRITAKGHNHIITLNHLWKELQD